MKKSEGSSFFTNRQVTIIIICVTVIFVLMGLTTIVAVIVDHDDSEEVEKKELVLDETDNSSDAEGRKYKFSKEEKRTEKEDSVVVNKPLEGDPYKELEELVGLTSVKEEVKSLANFVKVQKMREKKGLKTPKMSYHLVFTGSPGTGKTTVARIVARIYKDLGILKGNLDDIVANGAHSLLMPHGLGHMMGLDVHDMENYGQINVGYDDETRPSSQFGLGSLRCGRRLQPGFVITDEPGCYFIPALIDQWHAQGTNKDYINFDELEKWKDFGGIRIEDDILVTADGCRVLGKPIPKTVAEIEQTMNS